MAALKACTRVKVTKPYGEWKSEIPVDSLWRCRSMACIRACPHSGRVFYRELRQGGSCGLVEIMSAGELRHVLPSPYSVGSRVYEYGGSPFAVMPHGQIIFSNVSDGSVNVLTIDSGDVSCLVKAPARRYSTFDSYPGDAPWVIAVEENRDHNTPATIGHSIVAINTATGKVKSVVSGADFYYEPHFSPDGSRISWLQWSHPNLPFSSAQLFCANWVGNASVRDTVLIAGLHHNGVAEPRWGPDGSLFFGQEVGAFRELFRLRPGEIGGVARPVISSGPRDSELGEILWTGGSRTYCPLSSKFLAASCTRYGSSNCILINLETGEYEDLGVPVVEVRLDAMERLSQTTFLVIGAGITNLPALYKVEIGVKTGITTVRDSADEFFSSSIFSIPEHIHFQSQGEPKRDIHGFFWPPHNPKYEGPADRRPPLVLQIHGGPTAHTSPGLKLSIQYFTSRGYAYFSLNHAGSTGHGCHYREAIFGNWGIIDADDSAECVRYLSEAGLIDDTAVGITGGSSGGYTVLRALSRHRSVFAGGVCICGVSDLEQLAAKTHKLESHYVDALVLPPGPGVTECERRRIMRKRSPLYQDVNAITPLLLLHGAEDVVVPIEHSTTIEKAIRNRGGDVKLVVLPREGHSFARNESQLVWLREEERWWQRTLLRK